MHIRKEVMGHVANRLSAHVPIILYSISSRK
jgi:hypothetical protein